MINIVSKLFLIFILITVTSVGTTNSYASCAPKPESSCIVNVRELGAKGDGISNDTKAIQAAINQVAETKGTVFIPEGIYAIDALASLNLSSHMTLMMTAATILKALPNNEENFSVITIRNVNNVTIVGGVIQGERQHHQGVQGEWGHNIAIYNASNVFIEGVTVKDAWGDGLHVADNAKNITICSVLSDNNRRQGMSIINADRVSIRDSTFQNTHGTLPEAGIDIEPDATLIATNITIQSSQFINNNGAGIMVGGKSTDGSKVEYVTARNNTIINNGHNGYAGIYISHLARGEILQNSIKDNANLGINITEKSRKVTVHDNQVINNGDSGIEMYITSYNLVSNNMISNNEQYAIKIDTAPGNTIINNTCKNNKAGSISEFPNFTNYLSQNCL